MSEQVTPPPVALEQAYAVEQPSALGVLRNRGFLALWLSQVSTQVGGNMVLYGLTVHIAGLSPTGNYSAVSILFLCFLLPAALVSPIAGVYVDRLDHRLILVATNLLRAGAFVGMLVAGDALPVIYVLSIFVSTASTFFAPTEAAMIPRVVPRAHLVGANGLFLFTLNASFGLGFAVAGPLVRVVAGYEGLLLAVALLYGAAAAFCTILPRSAVRATLLRPGAAVVEAETAVASMLGELRTGIAFIGANRRIFWAIAYLALASSLIGVLGVLGPGFARNALGLTEESFVIIIVPLFLGLVTGILLLSQVGRFLPRRRLIEGALLVLGALLALLSVAGPLSRFLTARAEHVQIVDLGPLVSLLSIVTFIAFVTGMAYASIAIPAQTQLQEDLPEDVRGRVFGVLNMLVSVASFLPIIIVGPISDFFGTQPVIFAVGLLVMVSGVVSIVTRGPLRPAGVPGATAEPVGATGGMSSGLATVDPVAIAVRTEVVGAKSDGTAERAKRGEPRL